MARLTEAELGELEERWDVIARQTTDGVHVWGMDVLCSGDEIAAIRSLLAEVRESREVDAAVLEAARVVAANGEAVAEAVEAEKKRALAWVHWAKRHLRNQHPVVSDILQDAASYIASGEPAPGVGSD